MQTRTILVRCSEIVLKGKNRGFFESKLRENIRRTLGEANPVQIKPLGAAFLLKFEEPPGEAVMQALQRVFGIANFAPIYRCERDMEALKGRILEHLPVEDIRSFAVRAHRLSRTFPYSSMEMNRELGAAIQEKFNLAVNLDHPDRSLYIEVTPEEIYYYWQIYEGARGLPVGVSGKVMCLLSGGIDSPVAAYLMAGRGCLPVYVHFHSAPYTNRASIEKVQELVKVLESYHYPTRLYLVPFADLQKEIVTQCPAPLRVILYRRFMMRIAEVLARSEGARALVTGEALAQVASQTLPNLQSIDAVVAMPVLRPLIGLDKDEIVRRARRVGTYKISIEPDQDCCSYLMPRKPAVASKPKELEAAEQALDVTTLVTQTVAATEKLVGQPRTA